MIEHSGEPGIDDVEFERNSTTEDQRPLSDDQWMVYNCLRDRSGPLDLSALARGLVEQRRRTWKWNALDDGKDEERAKLIEIRLHHVVLPSLEELGIVEYDERNREVAPPAGSDGF